MLKQLAECAATASVKEPALLTRATMATSPARTTDGGPDPGTSRLPTVAAHALAETTTGDPTPVTTSASSGNEDRDGSEEVSAAIRDVSTTVGTVGLSRDPMEVSAQGAQSSADALAGHSSNISITEAAMVPSGTCKLPTPAAATLAGASPQICRKVNPEREGRDDSGNSRMTSPTICEIPPKPATIRPSHDSAKAMRQVIQVFTEAPSENGSNLSPGESAVASSGIPRAPVKVVTTGPFEGTARSSISAQVNWDLVVKSSSKSGQEPKSPVAYTKASPELIVGVDMESEKHDLLPAMQEETARFSSTMQLCSLCQKVFSNPSNLRQHYAVVHSAAAERPFGCTVCSKRFNTESNLRQHRRTHTGERPFPCPHCPRAFSTSTNLRQHERIHTGERPFACSDCPRAFSTSSNLRQHQRIHSGERPFECHICEKRFRSSTNLRQHGKIHEGVVAATIIVSEQENDGATGAEQADTVCEPKEPWAEPEQTGEMGCSEGGLPRTSTVSNAEDPTAVQNHSIMFLQVGGGGPSDVVEVLQGLQSLKEGNV